MEGNCVLQPFVWNSVVYYRLCWSPYEVRIFGVIDYYTFQTINASQQIGRRRTYRENVIAISRGRPEADPAIVVLLVSSLRQSHVFIGLSAEMISAFNELQHIVHR